MTISSLEKDIILLFVFLLAGYLIREVVKPLQKLYIPASVIGGVLALICGQQVLGLVELPESFGQLSGTLINLVMVALIFGITFTKERIKGFLDFTLVMLISYGLQLSVGTGLGIALTKFWPDLPRGWGTTAVFAFWGGHGNAAAAGALYKELGVEDNLGFGMVFATIGLISAIIVGMVIVNWGIKKEYAGYLKDENGEEISAKPVLGGVLPAEKQKSLGTERVPSISINNLALQMSFLALSLFVGYQLFNLLSVPFPVVSNIPTMARGMIGAAIVWFTMAKLGAGKYVDHKTISTISSFMMEVIITSAIATLRIEIVTTYFIPLVIVTLASMATVFWVTLYFVPHVCKVDWFEKALMNFGQTTGNAATGLALVRCVDPDNRSSAGEAMGAGSAILAPITGSMPAVIPLVMMQSGMQVIGIGLVMVIVSFVAARIFFWRKG